MSVYIIAEAGVAHGGDVERALDLVDAASWAGADAVKFQLWDLDALTTNEAERRLLAPLSLEYYDHERIAEECEGLGIDYLCTPFDEHSANFVDSMGCKYIKVASGEITNIRLLRHLASFVRPLIMSTGMSAIGEVMTAIEAVGDVPLTLLHCTSSYPCPPEDVNLDAMVALYNSGYDVGYSDHTKGITASIAAVARGAKVIEKHIKVLDKGPDKDASIDATTFRVMVRQIREIELMQGSPDKACQPTEFDTRLRARRRIVTTRQMVRGQLITEDDVRCVRPLRDGVCASLIDDVVGSYATRDIGPNRSLLEGDWI